MTSSPTTGSPASSWTGRYRRKGLSAVALQGALDLISEAGGGVVEGYPHDTQGKKKSVLYNGTRTLFERAGFRKAADTTSVLDDFPRVVMRLEF